MILKINFNNIYPIWSTSLWPERKSVIESTSAMMYLKGYDIKNMSYNPTFFGFIVEEKIVGVNSGHLCSDNGYRSRGLFVDINYRNKGIGKELLLATIDQGKKEGAKYIWSYPKKSSWNTYKNAGFTLTSDWEISELGHNAYCKLEI